MKFTGEGFKSEWFTCLCNYVTKKKKNGFPKRLKVDILNGCGFLWNSRIGRKTKMKRLILSITHSKTKYKNVHIIISIPFIWSDSVSFSGSPEKGLNGSVCSWNVIIPYSRNGESNNNYVSSYFSIKRNRLLAIWKKCGVSRIYQIIISKWCSYNNNKKHLYECNWHV